MKNIKNKKNKDQYIDKNSLLKLVYKLENQLIRTKNEKEKSIINNNIIEVKNTIDMFDRGFRLKSSLPFVKKYKDKLIKNETKGETKIKELLNDLNIIYEYQSPLGYNNTFYILDFYIPSLNICIEVDGGYHLNEEQKKYDKTRDYNLLLRGIRTIRITNDDSDNLTLDKLKVLLNSTKKYNTEYILKGVKVFDNYKLTFGKYKGVLIKDLKQLDNGYFNWLEKEQILKVIYKIN